MCGFWYNDLYSRGGIWVHVLDAHVRHTTHYMWDMALGYIAESTVNSWTRYFLKWIYSPLTMNDVCRNVMDTLVTLVTIITFNYADDFWNSEENHIMNTQ